MFSVISNLKAVSMRIFVVLAGLILAACQPVTLGGATGGGPKVDTSAPVQVALLVPGGSQNAGDALLAKNLENAARLAITDLDGAQIDLRVYNTAGQAGTAAQVAKQAVAEGAKIIVGPLYGEAANAAGLAVAGDKINVMAFSNNSAIAGGNVFILGNTFQNTANRLVRYAKSKGKSKVLVVHSSNTAGLAGRDAITSAVSAAGSTLAGTAAYEFSQTGVVNAVPRIASQARSSGADAIFFTSNTAGALPLLAQLLPENGVKPGNTQFMGLTRWDIPAATLDLPGVQGGWFTLADPALVAQFRSRYQAAYGEPPHPLAGLSYDGIAAIGALLKAGKADALTASALTQGSGFVGTNGVFRFRSNGTNQRGLAIAQIRDKKVVVIDAAPRSFGGAGF